MPTSAPKPTAPKISPPKISLCLITRDEEDFIAGCLESVAGVADEIIVVDTGSVDRTVEIARYFGAEIIEFAWVDDFAAARNVALDHARGEFVLTLDADERLSPGCHGALRELIQADDPAQPTLYLPLIVNVDGEGRHLGADHMARLWRHQPWIRFEGRIHEQAVATGGQRLRMWFEDRVQIIHHGYDPAVMASKGKHQRNLDLLQVEMQARPDDPQIWFHLARQYYAVGENAAALPLFQKVIAHGGAVNHALSAALFATECLRSEGQPQVALDQALPVLKAHPEYGALAFVAGQAALEAGRPVQASALFKQAHLMPSGIEATAFQDPSVARWRADLGRAEALLCIDVNRTLHGSEALSLLEALAGRVPEGPDEIHRYALSVLALLATGDETEAWARMPALIEVDPGAAVEPCLQIAERFLGHGGPEAALQFLEDLILIHSPMGEQVEILSAAAEAAALSKSTERQIHWLRVLVTGGSPIPEHYLKLAALLTDMGAFDAAAKVAQMAAKIMGRAG